MAGKDEFFKALRELFSKDEEDADITSRDPDYTFKVGQEYRDRFADLTEAKRVLVQRLEKMAKLFNEIARENNDIWDEIMRDQEVTREDVVMCYDAGRDDGTVQAWRRKSARKASGKSKPARRAASRFSLDDDE